MRVAILLAAGSSRRFGQSDKLLARFRGKPLVLHALGVAQAAPAVRVIVAVPRGGARAHLLRRHAGARTGLVPVSKADSGISASLKAAFRALRPRETEVLLFLGDMPLVPPGLARRLLPLREAAARPCHRGKPGHPVLLRAPSRSALATLSGDRGLRVRARMISAPRGCSEDADTRRALTRLSLRG